MAEREQRKFNAQHIANRRFHRCSTPCGRFAARTLFEFREFSEGR
jgi:hypothetical protein